MMTNNTTGDTIGSAHLDLAGNLIIKARFNNNFKKTTINNDELTYDELILMLQRLFNGKFDAKDDVKLKYRDEDGDLVDIDNDSDLKSAIQSNRYLKLVINLGDDNDDDASLLDDSRVMMTKKEFRKLTETMERILETLKTNDTTVKNENSTNSSFEPLNNDAQVTNTFNNLTLSDSKEFDPLVNKSEDLKSNKTTAQSNREENSIKSLNSTSQPATLQPSAQQFQSTQNLQSKILNQSSQFQPPASTTTNQPPSMLGQVLPQIPQQQPPMPYRYGMSPSNQLQQMPPINRPPSFNPSELPPSNQLTQHYNPNSHPPTSSYPTPNSTQANTFKSQQITSPLQGPQLSGPPSFSAPYVNNPPISGPLMSGQPPLSGPSTSINNAPQLTNQSNSNIQSGPPLAFAPPPTNQQSSQINRGPPQAPPPQGPLPHLQQQQQQSQQTQPNNMQPPNSAPVSNPSQNTMPPSTSQTPQGPPPQFTNFLPPTGPYPGQQTPKSGGNPFGRNSTSGRGYAYPQQQFN